ncbi:response regulator [Devosia chinhatensis]|uniref:Response regulatory domain-containing protein n=1 Tax=Devosia chinhatensis TaxID=429727 RepID=A0A0F5FEB9_9HYPH|nr:response regulator [Devosia chinhatensis]KKB07259.1 hypothetical protein VE26_10660 [Devosia chinhatensis]
MSEPGFIALVDDDDHSAYLLTRMMAAHGAPAISHFGTAALGEGQIAAMLQDPLANWPGLVIIDLKSHSSANLEFLERNQALFRQKGIPIAVMSPPLSAAGCEALTAAGAAGIFFRHAELDAYRREAAAIVTFWARHQRLDAIGM